MPRRQWDAHPTAMLVLARLTGKSVAEMCPEPQSSQSPYEQGRDQFLAQMGTAFEVQPHTRTAARLAQEHARLKKLVGALTWELNKSD